jgi:hypothetical protein
VLRSRFYCCPGSITPFALPLNGESTHPRLYTELLNGKDLKEWVPGRDIRIMRIGATVGVIRSPAVRPDLNPVTSLCFLSNIIMIPHASGCFAIGNPTHDLGEPGTLAWERRRGGGSKAREEAALAASRRLLAASGIILVSWRHLRFSAGFTAALAASGCFHWRLQQLPAPCGWLTAGLRFLLLSLLLLLHLSQLLSLLAVRLSLQHSGASMRMGAASGSLRSLSRRLC